MKNGEIQQKQIFSLQKFLLYSIISYLCLVLWNVLRIFMCFRMPATKTKRAFRAFILYIEIANFKSRRMNVEATPLICSVCMRLYAVSSSIYGVGVCCFQFISAMVFGDTRYKMSMDNSLRFLVPHEYHWGEGDLTNQNTKVCHPQKRLVLGLTMNYIWSILRTFSTLRQKTIIAR